jgi:Domain of unknown function (DUF4365)
MEKRQKPYIGQRAELMAQLFLTELGANVWATDDGGGGPFDLIAAFHTEDRKLRISAIEVKSTEQPVGKEFHFQANPKAIRALQHANVPVLFLVVDVKRNELFCGWASDIRYDSSSPKGKQSIRCTLPVVNAADSKEELVKTILSQPEFSESAAVG